MSTSIWTISRQLRQLVLLTLLGLSASAQQPVTTQAGVPDAGELHGRTYENRYFGVSISIAEGWTVQDEILRNQITNKGKDLVNDDDPKLKEQLLAAVDNTRNLLTVTQFPPGTPGSNAVLIVGAEKIGQGAGIVTNEDYLLASKEAFKHMKVPTTLAKDTYTEVLGGRPFSVIHLEYKTPGGIVKQRYYARLTKGFALFFIVTYHSEEQLTTQLKMLETLRFQ